MSSDFLKVTFSEEQTNESHENHFRLTPFKAKTSEIFNTSIKQSEKLTNHEGVKTVYKICLDLTDVNHDFQPGDTIGILPVNNQTLINKILSRLNVVEEADKLCEFQVLTKTTKKHLPTRSTLRRIFSKHVDINTPPKKLFLKSLARYANCGDRAKLEQLCSPKCSEEYITFVKNEGRTLLGLLDWVPSCQPPIGLLLEHLPPLLPRPYSISSSPLSNSLEIVFFVLIHPDGTKGVCTGWLQDLIETQSNVAISWYFREPTKFRLPPEITFPIILIGTGTGIAPFRGFLQHLKHQNKNNQIWLFYGCRCHEDLLFKSEFEECLRMRILNKLDVCFSREGEKCYVQDKIAKNGEFLDWVSNDTRIFICGNSKTVKDIKRTIDEISGKLDIEGRLIVDLWN